MIKVINSNNKPMKKPQKIYSSNHTIWEKEKCKHNVYIQNCDICNTKEDYNTKNDTSILHKEELLNEIFRLKQELEFYKGKHVVDEDTGEPR